MRAFAFALLIAFALVPWLAQPAAAEPDSIPLDEQTLRAAGLPTDGPGLLDFFHKRTQTVAEPDRLAALVQQLSDKSSEVRQQAVRELVSLGAPAIQALRQAAREADEPEASNLARQCLQAIEGPQGSGLVAAAVRVLAVRQPPGAAAALLAYLPYADDDSVVDEVRTALGGLALHDGKPEPVLVASLSDSMPLRRAVAVEALAPIADRELRRQLRKLLNDPRPTVCLRAGLALARTSKDPKAVSTVIAVLADVPLSQAKVAEEYLVELAAEQGPKVSLGTDDAARQKCRDAWAAWWLSTERAPLLEELTRRTLSDATREKALALLTRLGDDSFEVRERAMTGLQEMGGAIAALLRQHAGDADLEVSSRVKKILQGIDKEKSGPLSAVTARLLALRKPAGAVEAMLAFVPFTEDESIRSEVEAALAAAGERNGKVEPALVRALEDPQPLRRATAAAALWQAGGPPERQAVRALLQDKDPLVRMRVALALAVGREKDAIAVLIALLADLPLEQGLEVEELLRPLAGEHAPLVSLGPDEASRRKCRDAWAAWWKENGARADLARVAAAPHFHGYTMIIYTNPSRIVELAPDGRERWHIDGLNFSYDAQVLPGDRVLIAEYSGGRVSERTTHNDIIWEKRIFGAINCQRLPNGNTFIATRNQFLEVDKAGRDVFTLARPAADINAAQKLRDGTILCLTNQGSCLQLDASGKELKSFAAGQTILGGMEVLPGGHILVAQYNNSRVVELDREGKTVWEAGVQTPTSAVRLPNGNTLVASQNTLQVVELDRSGKVVWESKNAQQPWKARRR